MKKILIIFLVILMANFTLADFTDMFIEDGEFNGILVVGESAPSADTLAMTNIAMGLQQAAIDESGVNKIGDKSMLDSEVKSMEQDIISIGRPCVNEITEEIIGSDDCYAMLEDSAGVVFTKEVDGYTHMVVYGCTDEDTRTLSEKLLNNEIDGSYYMEGQCEVEEKNTEDIENEDKETIPKPSVPESKTDADYDNNTSTIDSCQDCIHEKITQCMDGDDFCPPTCGYTNDTDCPECQSANDCDDKNPCTTDICEKSKCRYESRQGCALEGNCVSIGTRLDNKYCAGEEFVMQKQEQENCINDYECASNICTKNDCVSKGTIKRLLDWFSNLF